jgi:CubicO group peptidase (beta-lactamase class C family)
VLEAEQLGFSGKHLTRIDALVERAIDAQEMPGCVVAIGRTGGVGLLKAYGQRQIEPSPEPMTVDTVFDLASLTKPIATATSIMILVERGEVRLRSAVAEVIPELSAHGNERITVEQLLTHHSGLIPDNPLSDYEDGPALAWERIFLLKPEHEPGTSFVYSDVNFLVLGEVIRRASGRDVAEFAAENIFRPLRMTETEFKPRAEIAARAAPTDQRDGEWLRGEVHDPRSALLGGVAGHAGLFSTASDLAIYCDALLRGIRPGAGSPRIMSRATLAEMVRPRDLGGPRRGLGWDIQSGYSSNRGELFSNAAFGHGGFTGTTLWIDPELDLFVIFLSNRLHPDGTGSVNDLAGRIGTIAAAAIAGANELGAAENARQE